jgi:hypothetical protein
MDLRQDQQLCQRAILVNGLGKLDNAWISCLEDRLETNHKTQLSLDAGSPLEDCRLTRMVLTDGPAFHFQMPRCVRDLPSSLYRR